MKFKPHSLPRESWIAFPSSLGQSCLDFFSGAKFLFFYPLPFSPVVSVPKSIHPSPSFPSFLFSGGESKGWAEEKMVAVASPLSPGGGGGGRRKGRKEGGEGKYLPGGREWSGGVYGVPSWFIVGTGAAPQTHVPPFLLPPP